MSRLKGADLGITFTNPTLASLGGAKNTIGTGLPPFTGRNAGDVHYDSTAKVEYVLTGSGGSNFTESFNNRTTGVNIVGLTTETGGGTYVALAGYANSKPTNSAFRGDNNNSNAFALVVGSGAQQVQFDYTHSGNSTMHVALRGSAGFGFSSGTCYDIVIDPATNGITVAKSMGGATVATLANAASVVDGTYVAAVDASLTNPTISVYRNGTLLGSYTDNSGSPLTGTSIGIQVGGNGTGTPFAQIDNLTALAVGTLAWTPTTVANPMNYRGQWSSTNTYAANDTTIRNGLLWLAMLAVPTNQDPANPVTAPQTQYAMSGAAMQGSGSPTGGAYYTDYTTAGVTSVTQVNIGATSGGGLNGSNVTLTITQGGTTIATSNTVTTAAGYNLVTSFTFPSTVTLAAGTTYRFTLSNTNLQWGGSPGTVSGSGSATAWTLGSTSPAYLNWAIIGPPPTYWQALAPTVENVNIVAASGATQTLPDITTATMHKVTLTANCTITLPTPAAGKSLTVELVQDGTGSRTVTWATPSGVVKWPGGTAPTLSTAAGAVDVIHFLCIGGTNWYGVVGGQAFA